MIDTSALALKIIKKGRGYLGPPFYSYALNCHFDYLNIIRTCPLFVIKQTVFVLFICNHKREINNCSNKHETGLVLALNNI